MAISTVSRQAGPFATTGALASFTFGFKIFQASDLLVLYTPAGGSESHLTLYLHYIVQMAPDQDATPGGTVYFVDPGSLNGSVRATSQVPNTQPLVLTNVGAFFPAQVNQALDRATIQIQQLEDKIDGSGVGGGGGGSLDYPLPSPDPLKLLGWNGAGTALVNVDRSDLTSGGGGGTGDTDPNLRSDLAAADGATLIGYTYNYGTPVTLQEELDYLHTGLNGVKVTSVSRSTLDNLAVFGTLTASHFYYITDEQRLAFATSTTAYFDIAKRSELTSGGGGSSGALRIVVMGDSMAAQQAGASPCWPERWAELLRNCGVVVELVNIAIGGYTYNKANTITTAYNGRTMVQRAIDLEPDVLVICLGANDAILNVEGRSLAQCQADANTALNALRAGLPSATIVSINEYMHDSTCFPSPGTTLKNKGVFPLVMAKPSSGILSGYFTSEMLDDDVGATQRGRYSDWANLMGYINAHTAVNGYFALNAWRAFRLGLGGIDGTHLTDMGNQMLAAYALKAAQDVAALKARWPYLNTDTFDLWSDPDSIFTGVLAQSGDGWVIQSDTYASDWVSKHWQGSRFRPETWFMPSGAVVRPGASTVPYTATLPAYWSVTNARPRQTCQVSVNGGAFAGSSVTDAFGSGLFMANGVALPVGTHTLRYRVGGEVFGPYTLIVTNGADSFVPPHLETYQGAAQSMSSGQWNVLVSMAIKRNDGTGSFSAGQYTAPVAGRYAISLNLGLYLASGTLVIAGVFVNGTSQLEGDVCAGANAYGGSTVSGVLKLNASDVVSLRMYASGTPVLDVGGRARSGTATISYLGA